MLKLIAGLERPDEGRVVIEGDDVTDVDPRHRDIGFCFQHYAPFRHMNVARNVGFGLRVRKQPKDVIDAKVAELLELVRLDGKAKSYPAQLSGGERQRMALARALAIEPRVLLLDEPFGALDAQVRTELRQWVKELHQQIKVTTILVTHDQDEAMEVADQLLIMHDGRIEQAGEPTELYERPGDRVRPRLPRAHDDVQGRLRAAARPRTRQPSGARSRASVQSIMELGFEVQVTVALSDGSTPWVQMSRNEFRTLGVEVGSPISIRERAQPVVLHRRAPDVE